MSEPQPLPGDPERRRILVAVVAQREADRAALSAAFAAERRHRVITSVSLDVADVSLERQPVDVIVGFVDDDSSWRRFRALARRYPDMLSVLLVSEPDSIGATADGRVINAIASIDHEDLARQAAKLAASIEAEWHLEGTTVGRVHPAEQERLARLTPRELEVLTLTAEGLSIKETAARLHRAYGTVAAHRNSIMEKLELHDRVALTRLAIRAGLISV